MSLKYEYTRRNSRYIHAGTPFRLFSYRTNLSVYIWNINRLFGVLAFCVRFSKELLLELDFGK